MSGPVRSCHREGCQNRLRYYQRYYCSPACRYRRAPRARVYRTTILDILAQNRDWWLTSSDIAIWAYGDDTPAFRECVAESIKRLCQDGHQIVRGHRHLTDRVGSTIRAYRLAQ